ncbi:MAG: hypothetical protein Q9195_008889 [Heterodermia aff. obscurata]
MSGKIAKVEQEDTLIQEERAAFGDIDHGEFDMGSDDGTSSTSSSSSASAPSKYTFYHPMSRSAQSGFVVRVESKHQSVNDIPQNLPRSSETYGTDDPPPLSPIEEIEDDTHIPQPESKPEFLPATNTPQDPGKVDLETRAQLLFSRQHLELILAHSELSSRFTSFLRTYRPDSVPLLVYLLDSVKALKAIRYAEAIIKGLEPVSGYEFTTEANGATMSWVIEDKADRALEVLAKDDLPAFIAYVYVRTVDLALVSRVTRKEDLDLRDLADGLAEVFVLSDPAQPDNPIVFASQGMSHSTAWSSSYLQLMTSRISPDDPISAIISKLGSDSNAQTITETLQQDAFEQLSETFNPRELDTLLVNRHRHHPSLDGDKVATSDFIPHSAKNVSLKKSSADLSNIFQLNGQGSAPPLGFYQNYLLVRPYPSLRILFASPDLRVAGILQSPLMGQIGGSSRVRGELEKALETGRKVTAKVQWISKPAHNTRSRWIHCTPLLGVNSLIAVWMVILVDDDNDQSTPDHPPIKAQLSEQSALRTSEVLPWDGSDEPVSPGNARNGLDATSISPSASQTKFANHDRRRPPNLTPALPDRNRLRKQRPGPENLMSEDHDDNCASSAKIAPFASNIDLRYNVSVWSDTQEPNCSLMKDSSKPGQGKPRFGDPSEIVDSNVSHFQTRPGPRINGKAYSFNSASEHGISAEDESAMGKEDERSVSRSSSSAATKTSGPSIQSRGEASASGQSYGNSERPTRKTYKSLSPYGVLFND